MNITVLSTTVPGDTAPLSPELQAACAARFSRSRDGIESMLEKCGDDPSAMVDRIFKFTDYGHASIGGLTGHIALSLEGVTMVAAYFLFAYSPYADGQESSTRYLKLDASAIPSREQLDMPADKYDVLFDLWNRSLQAYNTAYTALDQKAQAAMADPKLVKTLRIPSGASEAAKARMLKNYALDRARNLLPFALNTNVVLAQTARAWVDTIARLMSTQCPELMQLASQIKLKLTPICPRLMKHAEAKPGMTARMNALMSGQGQRFQTVSAMHAAATVSVHGFGRSPELNPPLLGRRANRYDEPAEFVMAAAARLSIPNLAIAELRDLNRHRTGHKTAYLWYPTYVDFQDTEMNNAREVQELSKDYWKVFHNWKYNRVLPWCYPLGVCVGYEHTMQLDKFVYMAELRTGPGAHYKYAQHLRDAVKRLSESSDPHDRDIAAGIQLGEAEPE